MSVRFIPLVLAAAMTSTAPGTVVAQSGAVEGPGAQPCAMLTEAQAEAGATYGGFGAFLAGFLMASNAYEDDTFDLTPWQPVEVSLAQLAQFCAANPDQSIAAALVAYIAFLRPDRLQEPSDLVEIANGETRVRLYAAMVDRIRSRLTEDGYDPGTDDAALIRALTAFQAAEGLDETGVPDLPTLIAIFR